MRSPRVFLLAGLLAAAPVAAAETPSLADLARAGRWAEVLSEMASRNADAVLDPAEALVVAHAARATGDDDLERDALLRAVSADPLGQVARAELAARLVDEDPEAAVDLVIPLATRAASDALHEAALSVLERVFAVAEMPQAEARAEAALRRARRSSRRRLDAVLAARPGSDGRERALRLLEQSTRDLPALVAAQRLAGDPGATTRERWLVAKTFFRHGQYERAAAGFDALLAGPAPGGPLWEVRFLRGRCAFRLGRWREAGQWYGQAATAAVDRETRADLEIHLARALELEGRLDDAIEAARHGVLSRATDDRRIFLARLRLANQQRGHAESGLSRVRGREARDRAELLLALDSLRHGDDREAMERLGRVRRTRTWRGPAAVLAAELDGDAGRWTSCARRLEAGATDLDPFWGEAARELVGAMPAEVRDPWLEEVRARGGAVSDAADRALAVWAVLEVDPERLAAARARFAALTGMDSLQPASGLGELARRLWELGLEDAAVTWAAEQFPIRDRLAAAWSAVELLDRGAWRAAMEAADAARWRTASGLPERVLPDAVRRALFPLPYRAEVVRAAAAADVPWSLLAGLVRAESRWQPDAVSAVGARGLTQMMPGTAVAVARGAGLPEPRPDDLFVPSLSLDLGASELGRLLARYTGSTAAAVAAYNAGEPQTDAWIAGCVPACSRSRFVLGVTFEATRSYTTTVLAAESAYRQLWEGDPMAVAVTGRTGSPRGAGAPPPSTAPARR